MEHIRPFRDDDRPAIVAIANRDLPHFRRYTVEDWRRDDAGRLDEEVVLRLVVGEPAVAYLEVIDRSTSAARRQAGVCELDLKVAHAERGRGIGEALYRRALDFSQSRGARTMDAWFYQYGPADAAPGFLRRRGFHERERRQTWHLALDRVEPARFDHCISSVEEQGVRIFSYADLPDDDAYRHKLYGLMAPFFPGGPSYDQWLHSDFAQIDWTADLLLIAMVSGEWVAATRTRTYNRAASVARVSFTGTLPQYRGRGIATALKARGLALMQQQGCRALLASNRVENHPILAINRHLGFEPGPVELTYVKEL